MSSFSGATLALPAGVRLRDLRHFAFDERATGGIAGQNAPYLRIFLNGYADDIIMAPSLQNGQDTVGASSCGTSSVFTHRFDLVDDALSYDNDAGGGCGFGTGAGDSWADIVAAHGNDTVDAVRVQAGDSGSYSANSTAFVDNVFLQYGTPSGTVTERYDFGG